MKKGTVIDDNKKPSDQNPSGDKTTVKGDNKNNKNTNTAKKADNTKKNQPKTGDNSHVCSILVHDRGCNGCSIHYSDLQKKTQKVIKDHKRYK